VSIVPEPSSIVAQLQRLRRLGDEAFVHRMIDLFLETAPPRVETIRAAVEAGDLPAAEHAAHSLKSSAAYLGAVPVQELAERIEELAARREAAELGELAARISEAMTEAVTELRQLRGGEAT
jgi:HPt (histidine-containing phosphotransfer) domain-containing protein